MTTKEGGLRGSIRNVGMAVGAIPDSVIIDDFEDGDLSEYSLDTGNFNVQQTVVHEGDFALEYPGIEADSSSIASTTGLNAYPEQGDVFQFYWYADTNADRDGFLGFGRQTEAEFADGYELRTELDNSQIRLGKRNGGFSEIGTDPVTWPREEWTRHTLEWQSDGRFLISSFDASGVPMAQIDVTDTDFTSGGIDIFGNSNVSGGGVYWDTIQKPVYPKIYDPVASTTSYDHESGIVEAGNGDLLVIYRSGTLHGVSTGDIVYRRSTDNGQTWGSETLIADQDEEDRNPSVFKDDDSGRIGVFWRSVDSGGSYSGTYLSFSDDNGSTWSTPSPVGGELVETFVPFGGACETSNGLFSLFYGGGGYVEGLFSTDGGQTWGSVVEVVDTATVTGHNVSESTPITTDGAGDNILVYGRDGETGEFYSVKSSDGGSTWGSPEYFNILGNEKRTPIYGHKTGSDTITVAFNWRTPTNDESYIFVTRANASDMFTTPTNIASQDWTHIQTMRADIDEDHGYATVTNDGAWLSWHDDNDPNIYVEELEI